MIQRVIMSEEAIVIHNQLKKRFGDLMFHQSGGCCDGSQPMCFEKGEFKVGYSDVCLGEIEGSEFWMSKDQFDYWKFCELTIDITAGRGSSFSLEIPMGVRFIVKSRMFKDEELEMLNPLRFLDEPQ